MESVGIMENRKKTYIADIERGVYDIKDEEHYRYKVEKGLTPESLVFQKLRSSHLRE